LLSFTGLEEMKNFLFRKNPAYSFLIKGIKLTPVSSPLSVLCSKYSGEL